MAQARRRPEIALLLACARARLDDAARQTIVSGCPPAIDWEWLLHASWRHSLLPLLYRSLSQASPGQVPPEVMQRLREAQEGNARRNLRLAHELVRVLRRLSQAGIPAIPYKGPVLAAMIYGDLGAREFSDLDILVPQTHVREAIAQLRTIGYQAAFPADARRQQLVLQYDCECHLDDHARQLKVEVHWRIAPAHFPAALDFDELWRRGQDEAFCGCAVRALTAEDLLLVLAIHGAKHLWRNLGWICDVSEVLQPKQVDGEALLRRAEAAVAKRMLLLGTHLAHVLLQAPLPVAIAAAISADAELPALAAEVESRLWGLADANQVSLRDHRVMLRLLDSPADRARYLRRLAFTPTATDWQAVALPTWLTALYPAVRIGRLVRKQWAHAPSPGGPAPRGSQS